MTRKNALVTSNHTLTKVTKLTQYLLDHYQPSQTVIVLMTAIVVGLTTGFGAIGFIWLIEQFQTLCLRT